MPTISSTLKMFDAMSRPLQSITDGMNIMISTMRRMQNATEQNTSIDTSLTAAKERLNSAEVEIRQAIQQASGAQRQFNTTAEKEPLILNESQAAIERFTRSLNTAAATNNQTFKQNQVAMNEFRESIEQATQAQNQFNRASQSGEGHISSMSSGAGGLLSTIKGMAAAYLSFQGIQAGMSTADSFINSAARLDLINDKLQTTAQLQQKIFKAANDTRSSYSTMVDVIGRMGTLAPQAFKGNDELIRFTELMQKSFRVGGSSTQEQQAGMYQLSQSMASGKLQGDEFRSIMENAPMLAQAIAKYTGKSMGDLRQMSAEGEITADIIKNAMFSSADQINRKFETMPKTFGDMTNLLGNFATRAFQPVIQRISSFLNSDRGAQFFGNLEGAINGASIAANNLLTMISAIYNFVAVSYPYLIPIIMGLVTAWGLYTAAVKLNTLWGNISKGTELVAAGIKSALTGATLAETSATAAQTAAQWKLNASMLASPITWIIFAIIALIVIIYIVVAAINYFAGTSISATGIVFGVFAELGVFIYNTVLGVLNGILQLLWTLFVEPWIGIIEWVLNVFNGGFDSFGDAVKNLLGNIISWFLSLGKVVTKIIDAIFGTDWTSGLNSLQKNVLAWGKKNQAITLDRTAPDLGDVGVTRAGYGDTWNSAYSAGANLENSVGKMFDPSSLLKGMEGVGLGAGVGTVPNVGTVDKVKKVDDTVDISSEDLKTMRELAEMKNIQNFVTLTPTVSVNTGDIRNGDDAETLIDKIKTLLVQEVASSASAAYS